MSETDAQKPVVRLSSTIDIQLERHGLLRFRSWTLKDNARIDRLCRGELGFRRFAERLLAQQSAEPLLEENGFQEWTDAELQEVAVKWWQGIEHGRASPIALDSLEGFQAAVRRRNDEYRRQIDASVTRIGGMRFRIPEPTGIERLIREFGKQKPLLDSYGQGSVLMAIERMKFDEPLSAISTMRGFDFAMPERLAAAALHEHFRDWELLSASKAIDFSRISAANSTLLSQSTEAAKICDAMSGRFRSYEAAFDSSQITQVIRDLASSLHSRFIPKLAELESLAAGFKTPWIDRFNADLSVTGVARMVALTAAARVPNPFELSSVAAIREALGDWREVKMPWRLLPDSNLREQFYIDRGFDATLIQLPEPAFSEVLEHVGLVRPPALPAVAESEEVVQEEILRQTVPAMRVPSPQSMVEVKSVDCAVGVRST